MQIFYCMLQSSWVEDSVLMLASNTAQVLTSLVEASVELKTSSDYKVHGLRLLQEALELFQRCLTLQEYLFTQSEERNAMPDPDTKQDDVETITRDNGEKGSIDDVAWAYVEQPVTRDSLIDTIIVQMEALTTICNLMNLEGSDNLGWIEEYYRTLKSRFATLLLRSERVQEVSLASAKLMAAFADTSFHHGQLDILDYEREIGAAFGMGFDLSGNPRGLCDRADAGINFSASIKTAQSNVDLSEPDQARLNEMRWIHITKALDDLTAASKIPNAENLPRIHLRRGDCELMRYCLGQGPHPYNIAEQSASTLVENAAVYYRGAAALARNADDEEEELEALVKGAIVASLSGDGERLQELSKTSKRAVVEIMEEMWEENLLYEDIRLG